VAQSRGKKQRECTTTIICQWCGESKEVTRGDAKTCSPACRSRLHRYTMMAGFPPNEVPGNRTAQQMFDLLIFELLLREKHRRELEAENNRRAAELLYGKKQ
jgi:hypothetical protein